MEFAWHFYGPYRHKLDFTSDDENRIQEFVKNVWQEVYTDCNHIFFDHGTKLYYTGTPFSKFSYTYNNNRTFYCDTNNRGYTVAYTSSLNGNTVPGIFLL